MKDRDSKRAVSLWKFAGMGVDLAAAVAGFTLIGYLADRHWQVFPRYTIAGAILGLVGGLYNLVRQAMAAVREVERRAGNRADGDGADGDEEPPR